MKYSYHNLMWNSINYNHKNHVLGSMKNSLRLGKNLVFFLKNAKNKHFVVLNYNFFIDITHTNYIGFVNYKYWAILFFINWHSKGVPRWRRPSWILGVFSSIFACPRVEILSLTFHFCNNKACWPQFVSYFSKISLMPQSNVKFH